MREGILEQFPTTLPKDKVVLVVGPEDYHGLNILKSQIQDMNRGDKWIRAEFRTEVSDSQVSDKVSVLLTMVGVKHGTLANMRRAASQLNICCPNQALTVSEVKEVLQILERTRKGETGGMGYKGSHNGNGVHPLPGKGEAQRLEQIGDAARRQTDEFLSAARQQPVPEEPANAETEILIEPHSATDIESALKTLENFGGSVSAVVEETQLAVMVIGDQLKVVMAECNNLRGQLEEKDREITSLSNNLANARKITHEKTALEEENKKLKAENARLSKTLGSLGDLIKGAQNK